jgi:hypothetical protein
MHDHFQRRQTPDQHLPSAAPAYSVAARMASAQPVCTHHRDAARKWQQNDGGVVTLVRSILNGYSPGTHSESSGVSSRASSRHAAAALESRLQQNGTRSRESELVHSAVIG